MLSVQFFTITPFLLFLSMIATGNLLYPIFWEKFYKKLAILLASGMIAYYYFILHNLTQPLHALAEYLEFITLISALYIVSGTIFITVHYRSTSFINLIFLWSGAVLANLIGTTGASMLLIRPYIRLNKHHIKAYHIIFFIFIVSNVGGCLTPIGDPPLFLGFLKGISFFWTFQANFSAWLCMLIFLSVIFYYMNERNTAHAIPSTNLEKDSILIQGKKNFLFLPIIILAIFLDPNIIPGIPVLHIQSVHFSFVREIIILCTTYIAYRNTNSDILKCNDFSFEPLQEIIYLFIGIFFTMMPALEIIADFANTELGRKFINKHTLFWATGLLSSFLDNAPTYINALTASMSSQGADINSLQDVQAYANNLFLQSSIKLKAISLASVFFGAMTYIGNGPNFMVKSIAEQLKVPMPSFFTYILKFSLPILLPCLLVIWYLFF